MTRNMIKRVEILFPVEDKSIGQRLVNYMNLQLSDNQKGRYQDAQGLYHYVENNSSPLNSQSYLMQEAIKYGEELKNNRYNLLDNLFILDVAVVGCEN